jgi:hypothetical protein
MLVELSVVEQRYHAIMEVVCGGVRVVEVAERYGVSRKTVHSWQKVQMVAQLQTVQEVGGLGSLIAILSCLLTGGGCARLQDCNDKCG